MGRYSLCPQICDQFSFFWCPIFRTTCTYLQEAIWTESGQHMTTYVQYRSVICNICSNVQEPCTTASSLASSPAKSPEAQHDSPTAVWILRVPAHPPFRFGNRPQLVDIPQCFHGVVQDLPRNEHERFYTCVTHVSACVRPKTSYKTVCES